MSFLMVFVFFFIIYFHTVLLLCVILGFRFQAGLLQFSAINIVLYVAQMPQPVSSMAK